jgi:hypothetical protein
VARRIDRFEAGRTMAVKGRSALIANRQVMKDCHQPVADPVDMRDALCQGQAVGRRRNDRKIGTVEVSLLREAEHPLQDCADCRAELRKIGWRYGRANSWVKFTRNIIGRLGRTRTPRGRVRQAMVDDNHRLLFVADPFDIDRGSRHFGSQ